MAKKSGDKILSEAQIAKKFPGTKKGSEIYLDADSSLWLPSRILALNDMLGGGVPYGKILDGHGEESAGKTALALDFAYCCQACGGKVLWADPEASWDPAWARANGVDPDAVTVLRDENTIERISDWIKYMILFWRSKLTKNEPILVVTDSLTATDTIEAFEIDASDSKSDMGKRAKKIGDLMRMRSPYISRYGVVFYAINQLRKKIGASMFEDPDTVPGGEAMKFYAAIRIGLYRGKRLVDDDDDPYGGVTYIRTKKNKVAPTKRNIKAEVYNREHLGMVGFNKYKGFLNVLLNKGIVEMRAGRVYYKGQMICSAKKEGKNIDDTAFIKLLIKKEKLRKNLIRKSGVNTISKLKERLSTITKNMYPVKLKDHEDEE
jgi:recombination protein RecA